MNIIIHVYCVSVVDICRNVRAVTDIYPAGVSMAHINIVW